MPSLELLLQQLIPLAAEVEQELPNEDGILDSSIDDVTANCCDSSQRFGSWTICWSSADSSD